MNPDDPRVLAALSGLAELLPLPLLDDALRRAVLRRALRAAAPEAPEADVRAIAGPARVGCTGCLLAPVLLLLRKLLRTVLFVFALKDVLDAAGEGLVRLAALRLTGERGWLDGGVESARTGRALDAAWRRAGRSAALGLLRGDARGADLFDRLAAAAGRDAVLAALAEERAP